MTRLRKLSGLPAAHLINSSALPDNFFHPRRLPIIFYSIVIYRQQMEMGKIYHMNYIKLIQNQ